LARQFQRQRFQIDIVLAAEAATDLGRNHLQLPSIEAAETRRESSFQVMSLGRGPELALPVFDIIGQAGLGLNIALVHRLGVVFAFDNDVGLGESGRHISKSDRDALGDVRRLFRLGIDSLSEDEIVQ
jgi:hypothetical protein